MQHEEKEPRGRLNADHAWLGLIGAALVIDVVLFRTERALLTDSARQHRTVAAVLAGVFVAHVFDVLGPFDPFRIVGRAARRRARPLDVA